MRTIRIGAGAGYAGDRIEPAVELMKNGRLDYIIFECLAERTIALAQQEKLKDTEKGFNPLLEYRMDKILPLCAKNHIKVITNMGAANPVSAAKAIKAMAQERGIRGLKIAAVTGDDVYSNIGQYLELTVMETGKKLKEIQTSIISANAYIGMEGIVRALKENADIVITGRVSDPSLTVGPLMHEFGWEPADYERLGKATAAGHLLECGAQVTGGYFADPGYKEVEGLWNVGFPIAEINENGDITLSKLPEAGGVVSTATVKEQIVYEIHDPAMYLTPDVIADFSQIEVDETSPDHVLVTGATGTRKSGFYKTSVGYQDGYIVEAEISYGGSGCFHRAKLAEVIIRKRIEHSNIQMKDFTIDFIGVSSLYGESISKSLNPNNLPSEVRLRIAARTTEQKDALAIGQEVEALYTNGPAGGGGVRVNIEDIVSIASILIPESDIHIDVLCEEV
ncbi:acyclic terpene utilization AtuA family protein [Fictibacillus sp. NRS-1165]|uniref:acyclic terpene utilization AtuA family protein n=1 Tax=Fictibacillus sp. NRS-1165 TaxID=3144463 RepID=UPI003D1D8927